MKKDRVFYFDNVKFVLMLLVVLCHFIDINLSKNYIFKSIFLIVFAFHMPLYIFISGLFFKSNEKTYAKAISYFSISFVLKFAITLIRYIFNKPFEFRLFGNDTIAWFLFALGVWTLLTDFIMKANINLKILLVVLFVIAVLSGFDNTIGDDFALSRIIVFYPFYILGVILKPESILDLKTKKVRYVFIICLLIWVFVCILFINGKIYNLRPYFTGHNPFSKTAYKGILGIKFRLIAYIISIITGGGVLMLFSNKYIPLITDFGSRTIQVYFWHNIIRDILQLTGIRPILSESFIGCIILFVISICITLVLSTKLFEFPTNYLNSKLLILHYE